MSREPQKSKKSTTVRISEETKGRLQKVAFKRTGIEGRAVTEVELIDTVLTPWLTKEERKLGI